MTRDDNFQDMGCSSCPSDEERQLHELTARLLYDLECVDDDAEDELSRHRESKRKALRDIRG